MSVFPSAGQSGALYAAAYDEPPQGPASPENGRATSAAASSHVLILSPPSSTPSEVPRQTNLHRKFARQGDAVGAMLFVGTARPLYRGGTPDPPVQQQHALPDEPAPSPRH